MKAIDYASRTHRDVFRETVGVRNRFSYSRWITCLHCGHEPPRMRCAGQSRVEEAWP